MRKLKGAPCICILILLLASSLTLSSLVKASAIPDLPVHNIDTGLDYATIQEAIDNAKDGDTIKVDSGTYHEHVWVNKAVSLVGENRDRTIVDSGGSFRGFIVKAKKANITGFTVQRAWWAIHLYSSGDNFIIGNRVSDSGVGIYLQNASSNTVCNNICENILPEGEGIYLGGANANVVSDNLIENASYGVYFTLSNENIIVGNTIRNCSIAISVTGSYDNIFYHNNLVYNVQQVENVGLYSVNTWDNGYPSGGNYWSDSHGVDLHGGSYQNETGFDWISDFPYTLDEKNRDKYPLTELYISERQETLVAYRNLLSNYTGQQKNYDSLQMSYNNLKAELNDIRNLMYFFIASTAVFLVATGYVMLRTPRARKAK